MTLILQWHYPISVVYNLTFKHVSDPTFTPVTVVQPHLLEPLKSAKALVTYVN